jgi:hypothetical protein
MDRMQILVNREMVLDGFITIEMIFGGFCYKRYIDIFVPREGMKQAY